MYTIQIPKPCSESWDAMAPANEGRHCDKCSKTVIDFTGWQQEDILNYLQKNASSRTCGRFGQQQLNTPLDKEIFIASVSRSSLPFYKKIAAVIFFVFGMSQVSCNTLHNKPEVGKTLITPDTPGKNQDTLTNKNVHTLGMITIPHEVTKVKKHKTKFAPPVATMGDVEIVEGDTGAVKNLPIIKKDTARPGN